jgi:hypothetical protein
VATVDVGLAPVALGVEDDRMEIDPTAGLGDQFDANGTPVGLDLEAETSEGLDGGRLVLGVDGEVEIPMGSGLATREGIDPPTASNPSSTGGACKCIKRRKHVRRGHSQRDLPVARHGGRYWYIASAASS